MLDVSTMKYNCCPQYVLHTVFFVRDPKSPNTTSALVKLESLSNGLTLLFPQCVHCMVYIVYTHPLYTHTTTHLLIHTTYLRDTLWELQIFQTLRNQPLTISRYNEEAQFLLLLTLLNVFLIQLYFTLLTQYLLLFSVFCPKTTSPIVGGWAGKVKCTSSTVESGNTGNTVTLVTLVTL